MDGVQTAVVSTCISCKTGTWRHVVCVRVCVCSRMHVCALFFVFVYVFALCVVWHIFTEGCVLSLSFGVRPEAMSNWSLHTFRLDSHWHARPWLSSLCHEKGKQWHRNMPSSLLRKETLPLLIYLFIFFLFSLCLPFFWSCCLLSGDYSLFSFWRNELFNHTSAIWETWGKVISVSWRHVAA